MTTTTTTTMTRSTEIQINGLGSSSKNLAVCFTCGTQFDVPLSNAPTSCPMCLDPRQFVPPEGQSWTSLAKMEGEYHNDIIQDKADGRIWSIVTRPQFAIGQRAVFIQTEAGNILWDCISLLDQKTIDFINSKGGLKAIAMSHPHFYSTHLEWAKTFDCPVYIAAEDQDWPQRSDVDGYRRVMSDTEEILPGVTMIRLGGHFDGSSVLHHDGTIFTGDTIGISRSGLNRENHGDEHQVFFFHWAYINFVQLGPKAMHMMWKRLVPWEFHTIQSLFVGTRVHDPNVKKLMLESMQRQARYQEHEQHALLRETWS